jgi:hypothetical protein
MKIRGMEKRRTKLPARFIEGSRKRLRKQLRRRGRDEETTRETKKRRKKQHRRAHTKIGANTSYLNLLFASALNEFHKRF